MNKTIHSIEYQGERFNFKKGLEIECFEVDGLFVIFNKELGIRANGGNYEEALESFSEDFIFTWNEIAQEQDDKLESKARELKRYLLDLVIDDIFNVCSSSEKAVGVAVVEFLNDKCIRDMITDASIKPDRGNLLAVMIYRTLKKFIGKLEEKQGIGRND